MVGGPPRQHPEPQPEDGLRHVFSTPIWTFSFPRAEDVNPTLRKVILEAAQSYPSQGRSNVGGWRSRNDLFHWEAPEVKEIGAWIMDCVRRVVEATAAPGPVSWDDQCRRLGQRLSDGQLQRPAHPSRVCLVGGVLRRYGRSRRHNAVRQLSGTARPAVGRGRSQHSGRSLWTSGSNTAPGRPAHRLPELADALGPPAFRPTRTDRHFVQCRCHARKCRRLPE